MYWWQHGGGKELYHKMIQEYDVQIFSGIVTPPEIFLQSTKPLKTLADLKGVKIRTSGDDGEILAKMGASIVSVAPGEIYESLKRGVIDAAQLSTPALDWSFGLQEVVDYMYLSPVRQPSDWAVVEIKKSAFEELPDDLKQIVDSEMNALTLRSYNWLLWADVEAIKSFKDYGTNVEPASQEIVDEMKRLAVILYDEKAAKDPVAAEIINSIRQNMKILREGWDRL